MKAVSVMERTRTKTFNTSKRKIAAMKTNLADNGKLIIFRVITVTLVVVLLAALFIFGSVNA